MARRHKSCRIHVGFGVAPVVSLPRNNAMDLDGVGRQPTPCVDSISAARGDQPQRDERLEHPAALSGCLDL